MLPQNVNVAEQPWWLPEFKFPHRIGQGFRDFSGSRHSHCWWLKWPRRTGRRGRCSHAGRLCAPTWEGFSRYTKTRAPWGALCPAEAVLAPPLPLCSGTSSVPGAPSSTSRPSPISLESSLSCLLLVPQARQFPNSANSLNGNRECTTF